MKVTIPTATLQKKLSFVNHAISSHPQLPILNNILLEVKENLLIISGTDLEIGIQTTIAATDTEVGGTTIPARTFLELISSITDDQVTLLVTENALTVSTKKTRSVFQTIAQEEFPKLYEDKGEALVSLSTKSLKHDFGSILFAASTDVSRPALGGILLKKEESERGKGILLVATDGYRLSLRVAASIKSTKEITKDEGLIIPSRVLKEMLSLKDEGETISLFVASDKNQILFSVGETILVGRLIEGSFPSYERIIPLDVGSTISIDRDEVLKAVRICSIFAREAANIIKFSLKKQTLVVSSQTPAGENTVSVDGVLTGEENEIAFNAKYLLDILSNLSDEQIQFEMTGPLNPGVFKVKEDPSFLHLIMPIRIQQ